MTIAALALAMSLAPQRAAADDGCANAALRETQHASLLPECRAYEMVTPSDKNGSDVTFYQGEVRSSLSGDALASSSPGAFAGSEGTGWKTQAYVSQRMPTGWATRSITPRQSPFFNFAASAGMSMLKSYNDELTKVLMVTGDPPLVPGAQTETQNLYIRDTQAPSYSLLTPPGGAPTGFEAWPVTGGFFYEIALVATTADFSRVLFEANAPLVPGAATDPSSTVRTPNLYEYAGGETRLVGILPNGNPDPHGTIGGAGAGATDYDPLSPSQSGFNRTDGVMSADGSRVYFTDVETGQLYLRENNGQPGAITKEITPPKTTSAAQPVFARFGGAAKDGSKAFFISKGELTSEDPVSNAVFYKLYMYDAESGGVSELTPIALDGEPQVNGIGPVSEDGEYVYFSAFGQLSADAPHAGSSSIYLWHNGEITYVGPGMLGSNFSGSTDLTYRATPDGSAFVFAAEGNLTGYDSGSSLEIYRFDALNDALSCVSCPTGEADGSASFGIQGGVYNGFTSQVQYAPRVLSDDGATIYFNTPDSLVSADTNAVNDVYQWRNGKLSLLSSGVSSKPSYFADSSPSGRDVFIATRQQLVGADIDNNDDIYDVRIDGGITEQNRIASQPCNGDGCRPEAERGRVWAGSASAAVGGRPKKVRKAKTRHRKKARHRVIKKHKSANKGRGKKPAATTANGGNRG